MCRKEGRVCVYVGRKGLVKSSFLGLCNTKKQAKAAMTGEKRCWDELQAVGVVGVWGPRRKRARAEERQCCVVRAYRVKWLMHSSRSPRKEDFARPLGSYRSPVPYLYYHGERRGACGSALCFRCPCLACTLSHCCSFKIVPRKLCRTPRFQSLPPSILLR
jgi:hypothetical protein